MANLAAAYHAARKPKKALPLFKETLRLRKNRLGADHPHTLISMNNLATAYVADGKPEKALPLLEDALRMTKAKLGHDHPQSLIGMENLAVVYCDAKKGEKAASLFEEYFSRRRKQTKPNDPRFANKLAAASLKLLACGQYRDAEKYLRECLVIQEKTQPDHWTTFNTQALLGGALLGQKKYADAEPLLLKGYQRMKQREKTIPPQGKTRLTEALQTLVKLYTAWGKPNEAARWRKVFKVRQPAKP